MIQRYSYILGGQVQGVGFRPFVYRTAQRLNLTGLVGNTSDGVLIEIQGEGYALDEFELALKKDLPPLAHIVSCQRKDLSIVVDEQKFRIVPSQGHSGHTVLVSPDVATCADCLKDIHNPENRRYGYAFTNCTNCGPRYTITRSIPYDRAVTTMSCFPLCPKCKAEYEDPTNRRFHAQPNACPICGPHLWIAIPHSSVLREKDESNCLKKIAQDLAQGKIVAVKGLGGFLLACDARNIAAVMELRRRKDRPHKSLAVMVLDLAAARCLAHMTPDEEALLTGVEHPIVVLAQQGATDPLPQEIAPDLHSIGVMLPYTPLHQLLLEEFAQIVGSKHTPALVMTSGNARGEPIALGNREAIERLESIADIFLLHNRDILIRNDDSVVRMLPPLHKHQTAALQFLRRARGFVPRPVDMIALKESSCILAVGAELKNTFCIVRSNQAFVSQHIGDLDNPETFTFLQETVYHLINLLEVRPEVIVRDKHPDYLSSVFAENFAHDHKVPILKMQHHFAHIYAVLAEYQYEEPALGLALDGTGLGDDGTIWGGELLFVHPARVNSQNPTPGRRLGRLSPFPLPGGDQAVREPWRLVSGFFALADIQEKPDFLDKTQLAMHQMILEMIKKKPHSLGSYCPMTSSCGRLFDAVSALLGICETITYEGQAAICLEQAQENTSEVIPNFLQENDLLELDTQKLFQYIYNLHKKGKSSGELARLFHLILSENLAEMVGIVAKKMGVKTVALAGGVLFNVTIAQHLTDALYRRGLQPLLPHQLPSGDGGLSLGQADWGRRVML